jgi:hypothetical protein
VGNLIEIVDWDLHYENNRTRELKKMSWVPMPNRQDGDGYTELLNHPNGAAHFGAWCALIEVASKCENPVTIPQEGAGHPNGRGILMRSTGEPHDEISLSRMTRIPEEIFIEAFPRLINIGWIRLYEISAESRTWVRKGDDRVGSKPQEGAALHARKVNGTEWNGTEKKGEEFARAREGTEPPLLSASPPQPEDAPVLAALRKVDNTLIPTEEDERDLAGLIARESLETIVAVFGPWRNRFPRKEFHWFLHDFPSLRAKIPKPADPAPPVKTLEEERAVLRAEIAQDPDGQQRARAEILATKRRMHIPLTEEEQAEEQELVGAETGPPAEELIVEQDDIPF